MTEQVEEQAKRIVQEKELVKIVEEKLKSSDKTSQETQAHINIAYFAGKQWIAYDQTNKKIIEPPKESWQVRFVANKIQPITRTELAKVTKNKFIMQVVPATNDDNDIKSSRIAEKVIEFLEYELDLQEKDQENCLWGLTTGIGFIKPYWNNNKGRTLIHPDTGEKLKEGDADADVLSLFEVNWDMTASRWDDIKWASVSKVRTIDYIKKVYGVDVEPEQNIKTSSLYDSQLKDLNVLGQNMNYKSEEKSVMVHEYWEKPSSEYPLGRRITIANNNLLYYEEDIGFGEEDNSEREIPLFPFFHINVPGRIIPTCVVEQLIPIQREYNKSRSQIIENKNLMANPIWLVEDGAMDEDISNMPGGVYKYKKGFSKPSMEQPASIGADVYKNLEMCDGEFYFISGQQEVSHGSTPPGVKSGVAISYLQEQDDTKLGPTIANFIRCKQKYMRYLLKMIQHMYTIERTIKLVGKNKKIEVFDFKGSDLTSIDVRIQEASMYQLSRSAKQDWIMNLVNSNVLNPETDKALILKMLELGITDDVYDEYEIDINQATNEQDKWLKGDFNTETRDFYNHEVHVNEHNKFRKSDDYNELPDDAKKLIDEHVAKHMQYVYNQQMQQPGEQPQGNTIPEQLPQEGVIQDANNGEMPRMPNTTY